MAASSVTGKGLGSSKKITTKDLASLNNAPAIYIAGVVESEEVLVSPPTSGNEVVFPSPLAGGSENYVVILTTISGGSAYVTDLNEVNGNFSGFEFITGTECTVMYIVVKRGIRPKTT